MNEKCIICDSQSQFRCVSSSEFEPEINCPVCGTYTINLKSFPNVNELIEATEKLSEKNYTENEREENKALLRYYVKQCTASSKRDSNVLRVTPEFCKKIFNNPFPNPIEQVNYLITFLGNTLSSTHKPYHAEKSAIEKLILDTESSDELGEIDKRIGDVNEENIRQMNLISATASINYDYVLRIVDHARELNFVKHKEYSLDLTIQGWQKYEELKINNPDSTTAFMAMQFGNDKLQDFYKKRIKEAVSKTGYTIEKVDENPEKDENINIDIMLKIRNSKFVIVDLSDSNNGAYWEAGYAEGLGKKVIYIFDESEWDKRGTNKDKKCEKCGKDLINKPHFDVDRNRILRWNEDDPDKFCNDLKIRIRYLFPEAKQKDE